VPELLRECESFVLLGQGRGWEFYENVPGLSKKIQERRFNGFLCLMMKLFLLFDFLKLVTTDIFFKNIMIYQEQFERSGFHILNVSKNENKFLNPYYSWKIIIFFEEKYLSLKLQSTECCQGNRAK
jgi:hypothetical protein